MSEKAKSIIGKIKVAIAKLPFGSLVAKVPALAKFSGYANYVACILVLIILGGLIAPSHSVGPAVKELKKINNENARFWIKMIEKNGIDAIYDKETLLTEAIDGNNYNLVAACIKSGANVNLHPSEYSNSPVARAVKNSNEKIVELLIKNKAVLVEQKYMNSDALQYALAMMNMDILKVVMPNISKADIDFTSGDNKRKEIDYLGEYGHDSKVCKSFLALVNDWGYKPKKNFYYLRALIYSVKAEDIPNLIATIKKVAKENFYKEKYGKEVIKGVKYQLDYRKTKLEETYWKKRVEVPEEIKKEEEKVRKQVEELISWLEKEGYTYEEEK